MWVVKEDKVHLYFVVWNSHIQIAEDNNAKHGRSDSAFDYALRDIPGIEHHDGSHDVTAAYPFSDGELVHGERLKAWLKAERDGDDVGPIVVDITKDGNDWKAEIINFEPDADGSRSKIYGNRRNASDDPQRGRNNLIRFLEELAEIRRNQNENN